MKLRYFFVVQAMVALPFLLALPAAVQAQFTYTTNGGSITITKYTGSGGAVTIPAKINGLPVTTIGHTAFEFCTSLTSITISNNLTSIWTPLGQASPLTGGIYQFIDSQTPAYPQRFHQIRSP